jgi:tRNA1(Val) A37 N6-methylase TrmN6
MFEYTDKSLTLTKIISINTKKNNGIYFTPPSIIAKHKNILKSYIQNTTSILEPSCGSGEYLNAFNEDKFEITAIELDENIFNTVNDGEYRNTTIINTNFLTWETNKTYDLIIGNPPYFVMKKADMPNEYGVYYDGRPNIFIAFIIKSLSLLNEGGILGFVLPVSFTNCLYYDKLRKYINENYQILDITNCSDDKYLDTSQETMLFTVKKQGVIMNDDFVYKHLTYTIFSTKKTRLELSDLYTDSTTLSSMGLDVNVGNVVWNQKKDILTDDDNKTRLIYSSDVVDNNLMLTTYRNPEKKNYIAKSGNRDLILVINRGYGVGKYKFNYCLIDVDYDYLVENHLICIRHRGSRCDAKLVYEKIMTSFDDEKTSKFIDLYFGNSAINTTELKYILPIY